MNLSRNIKILIIGGLVICIAVGLYFSNKNNRAAFSGRFSSGNVSEKSVSSSLPVSASSTNQYSSSGYLIYRHAKDVLEANSVSQDEFVLYNISTGQKEIIDFKKTYSIVDEKGRTPLLYKRQIVNEKNNSYAITAYDFKKAYDATIDVADTDISLSGFVASPTNPEVGYCSEEKEGTYYLQNLVTKEKRELRNFTGCPSDGSQYNPPAFSEDGKMIYFQDFGTNYADDGSYVQDWSYKRINVTTGKSENASLLATYETVSQKYKKLLSISTCPIDGANDVDSGNNCLLIIDASSITDFGSAKSSVDKNKKLDTLALSRYQHVGSTLVSGSENTFYFYSYIEKGNDAKSYGFKIGKIDAKTNEKIYPLIALDTDIEAVALEKATDKYVVFLGKKATRNTFDLYILDVANRKISLVEENISLKSRVSEDYFFVQGK